MATSFANPALADDMDSDGVSQDAELVCDLPGATVVLSASAPWS